MAAWFPVPHRPRGAGVGSRRLPLLGRHLGWSRSRAWVIPTFSPKAWTRSISAGHRALFSDSCVERSPREGGDHGRSCSLLSLSFQGLGRCLAHARSSANACRVNHPRNGPSVF